MESQRRGQRCLCPPGLAPRGSAWVGGCKLRVSGWSHAGIAGALLGLWIRQNYHRIQAGAEGRRAGAREGEPAPVPGAPVIAGMLLGAACGGGYHSLFGKLD